MKLQHIVETDLALYVSGDLSLFRRVSVGFHVRRCERCRGLIERYRADRGRVKEIVAEMPEGLNWDRLSREMGANIRVGLAAGECVAPFQGKWGRDGKRGRDRMPIRVNWRPAALTAGGIALLTVAWVLNMPPGTTTELGRAMSAVMHGRGSIANPNPDDGNGPIVVANQQGIELRVNDHSMGGSQDERPVAVTVSLVGSASERHVNADTGQMTITSVYVQ
jgi:anti-sigma factor RsiW